MAKYKVVFKGVTDRTGEGIAAFLAEFGRAYKMTPDAAKIYINRCKGLLYTFDDPARAEKAKSFLEKIGALAVIEVEGEPEPAAAMAPPEIEEVSVVMPGKTAAPEPAAPMLPPEIPEVAGVIPRKPPAPPPVPKGPAPAPSTQADVDAESAFNPSSLKFSGTPNQVFANSANVMNEPSLEEVPESTASERPCPKCGQVVGAGDDECPNCHIFISKYEKMMAKKAAERRPAPAVVPIAAPPTAATREAPADVPAVFLGEVSAAGSSSSWPMVSLVSGLLGLVIFLAGPVAVLAGIKALVKISRNPGMGGGRMAVAGLVLGIVDTVGGAAAVVMMLTGMNPFS